MAHFEKFKRGDAKRIAREASRKTDSKSEYFDKEKSENNFYYEVNDLDELLKKYPPKRKDAVITINEVITKPKGLKEEDEKDFYLEVMKFTSEKLNSAGVYYIAIHNDEYTQHAHISFLALNKDTHKWQAKNMLNKTFLNSYHRELEKHLMKRFNYLIEIRKDNKEEHLDFEEYKRKMKEEDKKQEQNITKYFEL